MTYQGVVLLLSGYQADEHRLLKQYADIVDEYVFSSRSRRRRVQAPKLMVSLLNSLDKRYPNGALWLLNRVCLLSRFSFSGEVYLLTRDSHLPRQS